MLKQGTITAAEPLENQDQLVHIISEYDIEIAVGKMAALADWTESDAISTVCVYVPYKFQVE